MSTILTPLVVSDNQAKVTSFQCSKNTLLEALPANLRKQLMQSGELVKLELGTVLCEPEQDFQYAYFPLTCFISVLSETNENQSLEAGLIGNEGLLGATLSLGITAAPMRALVQKSGTALRITATQFQRELRTSNVLSKKINHYIYVLFTQLVTLTSCIHFHQIEPRLARRLLMTHDRAHRRQFHVTQDSLAAMLGVRRSGVTVAAGKLQARKLIDYSRGDITILDRKGLEEASCSCYQSSLHDYDQILD